MSAEIMSGELVLAGDVGDMGFDEFFTAADVRAGLAQIGRNRRATVRLNSGGGSAWEGSAIANVFLEHKGGVEIIVEGVAASAASVAACGAGRITMTLGAVWMLHEASVLTIGTAEDHASAISALDTVNRSMAAIYSRKSGVPVETIREMMAAETWMTADDAVDAGFADAVAGQDQPRQPARFAYAARYRHPPAALLARTAKPRPAADAPLDPAVVAEMCAAAEQSELTASLIRERVTLVQARDRLDVMATIRPMAAMLRGRHGITAEVEQEVLSGRLSVVEARTKLLEAMADADAAIVIDNKRRTGDGSPDGRAIARKNMEAQLDRAGIKPVRR